MDMTTLRRIAGLAKLEIAGQEDALLHQFAAMAEYGASLPPAEIALADDASVCPLREDVPGQSLPREKVLMGAARVEDGCIAAPRAFD